MPIRFVVFISLKTSSIHFLKKILVVFLIMGPSISLPQSRFSSVLVSLFYFMFSFSLLTDVCSFSSYCQCSFLFLEGSFSVFIVFIIFICLFFYSLSLVLVFFSVLFAFAFHISDFFLCHFYLSILYLKHKKILRFHFFF